MRLSKERIAEIGVNDFPTKAADNFACKHYRKATSKTDWKRGANWGWAQAREDIPALLSEIDRLNKVVEEAIRSTGISFNEHGQIESYDNAATRDCYPSLAAELEARKEEE